jgi:hypothetical protein
LVFGPWSSVVGLGPHPIAAFGCQAASRRPTANDQDRLKTLAAKSDLHIYALSAGLGLCAGFLDVKIGDLLLTALFVLAATMLLGALRPQRPWRWTVLVAVFVPVVQIMAYLLLTEKPYRAQIYESFLGFLTGIAGAYGGATARRGLAELWRK